jgi:glucosylglycerate synthase
MLPAEATMNQDGGALPDEARRELESIGSADVLVGIPSIDSAETIEHVVTAVEAGLRKHFAGLDAVICVSDGGSTDGTLEVAARSGVGDRTAELLVAPSSQVPRVVGWTYRGPSGKGSAFRAVFEAAGLLGVRACAVVDSDLRSITPAWLDSLLTPIVHHGFEYVTPLYARHKYDGTITNSIAYPLTTALYGARIRQPIGGEFGLSGDLARHLTAQDVWDTDVARFGIDIWMTTAALARGAKTGQAILGAKIHDPKDPGGLGPMFRQVVGSLFTLAGRYADRWWSVEDAERPPTFGIRAAFATEPVDVSLGRLTWSFVNGWVQHQDLWRGVLSEGSMRGLEEAVADAADDPRGLTIEAELWLRIVFDYLAAYNAGDADPEALLDSLIPLYFARTASFVQEARDDDEDQAEARVEAGVDLAVRLKPYLRERWSEAGLPTPDRAALAP